MFTSSCTSHDRVVDWIDQTTSTASGPQSPASATRTRQRRQALRSNAPRPARSTLTPSVSPRPRPLTKGVTTALSSTTETASLPGTDELEGGQGNITAYPALVLLVACFLCAALLPSMVIILLFAGFLGATPRYDSVQTATLIPRHLETSDLSLDTDGERHGREAYRGLVDDKSIIVRQRYPGRPKNVD